MIAGDLGKHLSLTQQPRPARRLGPAMGGAEHAVEHRDGEVGKRGLALDDEGDEGREPPFGREAHELAGVNDLGLARDDAVAVGVDGLATVIGQSDRP